MRIDRKIFLIAPAISLAVLVAGLFFAATRLGQITEASGSWQQRDDFVAAVQRGQKALTLDQATRIVRFSLDAERRRTDAITAVRELIVVLSSCIAVCTAVLLVAIRGVPRVRPIAASSG